MDPGGRVERDTTSGAQQTSDELGTGGQWDNPASRGQGKWENRQGKSVRFLCQLSLSSIRTGTACTGFRHLHLYFC